MQEAFRLADETGKRLDAAQAGLVIRAKRIEDAGRDNGGGAVPVPLAAGLSGIARSGGVASRATIGAAKRASIRDRRKQGASDAGRVLDKLKSGFFNLAEPEKARKILVAAVEKGRKDPAYAAGFLARLGPTGLAKILDDPTQDPCVVGELVARASVARRGDGEPEFDHRFLDQTLGTNKGRAAQRATALGGCECPGATFHPVWTERLVEVLYLGPDTATAVGADTRDYYRPIADRLITQLETAPPGLARENEDALERVIKFANDHPLESAGNAALARILSQPAVLDRVAIRLAEGTGKAPDLGGFRLDSVTLRTVLAQLTADPASGKQLLEAATDLAARRLEFTAFRYIANEGDSAAREALLQVGALFGSLASRSYDFPAVAVDVAKVGRDTVKGLLEQVGGVAVEVAKGHAVVGIIAEGGKRLLFTVGSEDAAPRQAQKDVAAAKKGQKQRSALQSRLDASLRHLAHVAVLSDPRARAKLPLRRPR